MIGPIVEDGPEIVRSSSLDRLFGKEIVLHAYYPCVQPWVQLWDLVDSVRQILQDYFSRGIRKSLDKGIGIMAPTARYVDKKYQFWVA